MRETVELLVLGPAALGLFTTIRYLAYLAFALHVSRAHGVRGIEAMPFVAQPGPEGRRLKRRRTTTTKHQNGGQGSTDVPAQRAQQVDVRLDRRA